jgi:hypothetical protein
MRKQVAHTLERSLGQGQLALRLDGIGSGLVKIW